MRTKPTLLFLVALTLVAVCAIPGLAQELKHYPTNPGVFKGVQTPLSPEMRFWASDRGKDVLLHSTNPAALGMLHWFHPEAVSQYPQEPLHKASPVGAAAHVVSRPPVTTTGCGTTTGTVMNLESPVNAVGQYGPLVDFILSELGSGQDLVAEFGYDVRGLYYQFDSYDAFYVHRDATQPCYGGSDFEMGNPPIADPFGGGLSMTGMGGGRMVADPNPAHKQFILADMRFDDQTSGIALRRIAASNLESTSKCPAGTLTTTQEATCAGTTGIIVFASEDNASDAPALAQDPRTSGTGAGDIYVVSPSVRELRTVLLISACKATFASISDCSSPIELSGGTGGSLPSIAVVGGGPNAGAIAITYVTSEYEGKFISCTPNGAPSAPTCGTSHTITTDTNFFVELTDNLALELTTWPQIVARTDSGGQTLFVTWGDCKAIGTGLLGCPQAEIVVATATSLTSPSWALHHIYGAEDRFLPNLAYDPGQGIVTVGYYTTAGDAYKNRKQMAVNQFPAGSTTPGSTVILNTTYDSLEGDGTAYTYELGLGDFVGIAAHGGTSSGSSRVYVGFTSDARPGTYGTITNTQADNDILRATY